MIKVTPYRYLLALALAIVTTQSHADFLLTWDKNTPIQREDGRPFAKTEIAFYRINFIAPNKRGYKTAKPGTNSYIFYCSTPGTYTFDIQTVDKSGRFSQKSIPVSKIVF